METQAVVLWSREGDIDICTINRPKKYLDSMPNMAIKTTIIIIEATLKSPSSQIWPRKLELTNQNNNLLVGVPIDSSKNLTTKIVAPRGSRIKTPAKKELLIDLSMAI